MPLPGEDAEVSPQVSILLAALSETSPDDPPAVDRHAAPARDSAWWFGLRKRLGLDQKYPYLADLPPGYDNDSKKLWPLILYLHGGNQNGNNLALVRKSGLPDCVAYGKPPQAVIISPQAPWYEDWNPQILGALLDETVASYRVDPDRVYVTGISSGAIATWRMALEYPNRFAAIFPIGGDSDPEDVELLTQLPVWAFTGGEDDVIPAEKVIRVVEAIREAGGNPHITVYPRHGHDVEYMTYLSDDIYRWLFAQKRGQPEVTLPGLPESFAPFTPPEKKAEA